MTFKTRKNVLQSVFAVLAVLAIAGCAATVRVPVPPKVELAPFGTIGLVGFTSNANDEFARFATRRFLESLHAAQPGTRIVELGPEQFVLGSINRHHWDSAAFRALKKAHGIDGVLIGRLDVKNVTPGVQVSTVLRTLSVQSDVESTLSVRLVETATGATMWTDSARVVENLANARFNDRGEGFFGAKDADAAYGRMVNNLVHRVTGDLRTTYVRRRVEELQASAAAP